MKISAFIKNLISSKRRKNIAWRKKLKELFPNSDIVPINRVSLDNIKFGDYSYGPPYIKRYGFKNEGLEIGSFVSIAEGVVFLLGGEHKTDSLTSYPLDARGFREIFDKKDTPITKKTVVKDDVWLGYGVTVLSGVTIGQGVVVGARALVTKDLEPYGIYGGVPAKLIRYRFSDKLREKLLKLDLKKINFFKMKDEIELYDERLTEEKLEKIINKYLIK